MGTQKVVVRLSDLQGGNVVDRKKQNKFNWQLKCEMDETNPRNGPTYYMNDEDLVVVSLK